MYRISLITIGTMKPGPQKDLAEGYVKRLKYFAKIDTIQLKEEKFRSASDADRVKKSEADRIGKALDPNAFQILLTEHGDEYTSPEFVRKLETWGEHGARPIQFIIGGPLGLDPALRQKVDATLALSKMTFPHDIAHVLLLEQLYRAFTIQTGKTYHY